MIEFDVDMSYLLECDELDKVVLNDESGEHEPMEFVPKDATVGRRDTMELWPEWEQVLFANVTDEVAQDNLNECVHELLDKAATADKRSCASCPEMDNPDSYIVHLHRALEVADSGAGTCHNVGDKRDFCCSECGVRMFIESDDTYTMIASDERTIIKRPNFCPNCGKRVDR